LRAAARDVTWAICEPVTSANEAWAGRPSSSLIHAPHTSSTTAAAGLVATIAAFWSQAEVSQSAATAVGSAPPMTQPKKRPPPLASRPGSTAATSSSITRSGGRPTSGSGPPSVWRSSGTDAEGATRRWSMRSRKSAAWRVVRSSSSRRS
jgi:hypothetical protein